MLKGIVWSAFLFLMCYCKINRNNVCKSMDDYITINDNENCWYNPDVGSSAEEIITRRGYPFQSYEFVTEDNYINVIYRIPRIEKQPILLHGGFGGGPLTFLYIGNRSLAFYLANNEFDVWLSNRRGSLEGKGHRYYNRSQKEFWDFSFHETGFYDMKAEIDLIARKTKSSKLIIVGYSMGTTESYIYSSLRQAHAKNHLAGIISLSPIAFMEYSGGVVAKLAPLAEIIEGVLRGRNVHFFYNELLTEQTISYETLVRAKTLLTFIVGDDSSHQFDAADIAVYLKCKPTPSSIKTLVHFAQEVNAGGKFQHYDYGPIKNLMMYNSLKPPAYNLSAINVPVHLFYGEGDLISAKQDVFKLYRELTIENKSLTCIPADKKIKFNHVDFTLAKDVEKLLHEVLLKTIKKLRV